MGEEAGEAEASEEVDADDAVEEAEKLNELSDEDEAEEESEAAGVSQRGKVVSRMISYISNESKMGKSLKTGELRKKMKEPAWNVPEPFNLTSFEMDGFSMKMLSSKENPDLDHVILQLHGGGYMGAIRNAYYVFAGLYNEISHGMNVLCPDYRVAPENPYPAALEDAVASYKWLLTRGYKAGNIVVAGDSAGGGLAMALCMYLRDNGLPMPGGIIAMSPWTDLTASGASYEENFDKDPLFGGTRESLIYINAYPGDHDKTDPYISPLFGSFKDFPPMLIQVGGNEMLLSDSEVVAAKARDEGVKVRLHVYEGMFHVFQMAYTAIPESKKAWIEVGKFFEVLF
ncbi:MAG: alpha/beta hydrolase [Lachnospiraceae bacterium]|nr:alpha/beta hydrolase [Lachnospiraceae bacterium]